MTVSDKEHLPWKRWWIPVDAEVPSSAGFLDDPDGPYAEYMGYRTTTLADLDRVPCLVLLGEAGMGKSYQLQAEKERLAAIGASVIHIDLGGEPDLTSLRETLAADVTFTSWRDDEERRLVLLLDSFDEATITMSKLTDGLLKLFDDMPLGRLSVRIVSRSSSWSNRLETGLEKRFTEVQCLTLCPLTLGNARLAAEASGITADDFLTEVRSRDLGALAARPLTLKMLVSLAAPGPLPASRTQLYHDATELLARENSERRQEERNTKVPTPLRLLHARRLATLGLLTGRPTIRSYRPPEPHENYLVLDDITGTGEERDALEEVLQSGLFTAAARGTVRFAHRSIAEFLAAEALAEMPVRAVSHLLTDPLHPGKVVPQLAGTAVWAAALRTDIYEWLASTEPELLFTPNLATASEEQRRVLVQAVLRNLETNVPPRGRRYFFLAYDGLAADVAPYLDDHRDWMIKTEAAHILSDSGCHDLDGRLVEMIEGIAQRRTDDYLGDDTRLATALIYALDRTQDPSLLDRLAKVADHDGAPRHLRVEVLGELWGRLPTSTLLPILTRLDPLSPRSPIADAAATALARAIRQKAVDANELLEWVNENGLTTVNQAESAAHECDEEWHQVIETLALALAGGDVDLDDAHEAILAKSILAWEARTHTFVPSDRREFLASPVDGRRRLALALLQRSPSRATGYHMVQAGLLQADDLEWLLRSIGGGDPTSSTVVAAKDIAALLTVADDADQEALARQVAADHPALTAWVDERYSPEWAKALAEQRVKDQAQAAKEAARKAAHEFNVERLHQAVAEADFRTAARELGRPHEGKQLPVGAPLAASRAWSTLDDATRTSVANLAADFLAGLPANITDDQADDVADAYALVRELNPPAADALNQDHPLLWLDIIRKRPAQDHPVRLLVHDLQATRADQLESVLVAAIREDAGQANSTQIRKLGDFTTTAIEDTLYDLALGRDTQPHVVRAALEALLARDSDRGVSAAHAVMRRRPASRPTGSLGALRWRQAVHAAAALVSSTAINVQLDPLLQVLSRSPDLAADVIHQTGQGSWHSQSWPTLTSDQFATLYLWARDTLPPEPEHPPGMVISVNEVHEFPNMIFNRLAAREEPDAVAALERIASGLGRGWPLRSAADVARRIRENEWRPMAIADVEAILKNPTRRAVTSEAHLAQAFLNALDDVAEEIERDPDVAAQFWDKQAGKPTLWRPVDENTFTTRLIARVQNRLDSIVLRQEAQLHRGVGSIKGSYPDIEAIATPAGTALSVAGEAKGNWHPEVRTAIKTQLAERYVSGVRTNTGVYVVGFFASDKWDPDDTRCKTAIKHDLETLRAELQEQARELSNDGKTIHARVIPIQI